MGPSTFHYDRDQSVKPANRWWNTDYPVTSIGNRYGIRVFKFNRDMTKVVYEEKLSMWADYCEMFVPNRGMLI